MVKKIVIDPGHGGNDPGAEGFGLQEKNINLDIALRLRKKLAHYTDIIMTRSGDVFVSLSERAAIANRAGADCFIAIHLNAGGGTGFESYTYTGGSVAGETIRSIIHKEMAAYYQAGGFPDRGMKKANFAVLRSTNMPSVLLENLFIDHQADADKLRDPSFRDGAAGAMANGLIKALKLQGETQPPHWAARDFARLQQTGLVNSDHDLDSSVTWGEMSAVLARLLDIIALPTITVRAQHWADNDFARLQQAGLVNSPHDLDAAVSWGEMSAVLARLLDKLKL